MQHTLILVYLASLVFMPLQTQFPVNTLIKSAPLSEPLLKGGMFIDVVNPESVMKAGEDTASKKVELYPQLRPVCACESVGDPHKEPTHFAPDGSVLRGKVNKFDKGICQLNVLYHGEKAKEMGLNLLKEEDNITYANWLYNKEHLKPWSASRKCWLKAI